MTTTQAQLVTLEGLTRALNFIRPSGRAGWTWSAVRKPTRFDPREYGDRRGGNAELAAAILDALAWWDRALAAPPWDQVAAEERESRTRLSDALRMNAASASASEVTVADGTRGMDRGR